MNIAHLPPHVADWVAGSLGSNSIVEQVWQLKGSTSSDLFKIQLSQRAATLDVVLRLLGNNEWLKEEPDLAIHEASALKLAKQSGLAVPEIIAWDVDGMICSIPAVLMTHVPGEVNLKPLDLDGWLKQQAEVLLPIHAVNAASFKWEYFPYNDPHKIAPPHWSKHPEYWSKAIEFVRQPAPASLECFIHRDYHPMNTLWQGQKLSGIVDWVNACRGPASFDLAWNRINLMQMYGVQAADRFLELYLSLSGTAGTYDPYWDLMAIIELLPGPPGIYAPWKIFGLSELTDARVITRSEEYLSSVLKKF